MNYLLQAFLGKPILSCICYFDSWQWKPMPMLVDMCYFMLKSYCISMFRMLLGIHVSSGVLIKPISLYVSSVVHSGTFGVHRKVTINT